MSEIACKEASLMSDDELQTWIAELKSVISFKLVEYKTSVREFLSNSSNITNFKRVSQNQFEKIVEGLKDITDVDYLRKIYAYVNGVMSEKFFLAPSMTYRHFMSMKTEAKEHVLFKFENNEDFEIKAHPKSKKPKICTAQEVMNNVKLLDTYVTVRDGEVRSFEEQKTPVKAPFEYYKLNVNQSAVIDKKDDNRVLVKFGMKNNSLSGTLAITNDELHWLVDEFKKLGRW